MRPHRNLELLTFVKAVSPDVLQRYLKHFEWEEKPQGWLLEPGGAGRVPVEAGERQFRGVVLEELGGMNDVCSGGMNFLVRAYRRAGSPLDQERTGQELAMRPSQITEMRSSTYGAATSASGRVRIESWERSPPRRCPPCLHPAFGSGED
jgi:hypothetical protein